MVTALWAALCLVVPGSLAAEASAAIPPHPTVILVDKATNNLRLAEYSADGYKILKTYHATVGKVKGDKEDEGDLKTPEGIYRFTARLTPPTLKPKFGVMAFYMDFPNSFDRLAGRTGSHIMLHATNEPDRLKNDYDSEGCIVMRNEEIEEIRPYVKLSLTPILVFEKLDDGYLRPEGDERLSAFFRKWVSAWESKEIESYIGSYHSGFGSRGMNRAAWKAYKEGLNKRYDTISVGAANPRFYRHPKYSMITFTQNYQSTVRGGREAYSASGTKILYVAEEDGEPRIISEEITAQKW